jgi:hypothetical protein
MCRTVPRRHCRRAGIRIKQLDQRILGKDTVLGGRVDGHVAERQSGSGREELEQIG